MMVLPDAIFCHKFVAILGEDIRHYLFDKDFEVTGITMCTECISYHDTCIDCCIGNDQQILDALSSNKSFKVRIQERLDIMDAFFRVIPTPKRNHPSLKEIFLPLEKMMRFKLHSLLKKPFINTYLQVGKNSYKINLETFFHKMKSYQHLFCCNEHFFINPSRRN